MPFRLEGPLAAVVFDMDGTLLDTEAVYRDAMVEVSARMGVAMDDALHLSLIGQPGEVGDRLLRAAHGEAFDTAAFRDAVHAWFEAPGRTAAPLKPGALELLQADMKILPVGVAAAGAWKYAFIYDIVPHHYPELPEKARLIGEAEARGKLADLYFRSVGAAQPRDLQKLFGWSPELTSRTIKRLQESGQLLQGYSIAGLPAETLLYAGLLGDVGI